MVTEQDRIKKELIANEEQLLENKIRTDAGKIAELIDDDCLEFTSSGKQNQYHPGELFEKLDGVFYIDSNTVKLIDLSEDCKLLAYVAAKVLKNSRTKSNCSSVWKKIQGNWKIVFHQETNGLE